MARTFVVRSRATLVVDLGLGTSAPAGHVLGVLDLGALGDQIWCYVRLSHWHAQRLVYSCGMQENLEKIAAKLHTGISRDQQQ